MNEPIVLSFGDLEIGARTLAQEARGASLSAQQGVAWVMRNRLASGQFGHSLMEICLENRLNIAKTARVFQFSGWRGEDPNFAYACALHDGDPVLEQMTEILDSVFDGSLSDLTSGALFYHDTSIPTPSAWHVYEFTIQLDKLKFFKIPKPANEGAAGV